MMKYKEQSDPNSCLNKADSNELIFVLLGRDPAAPAAIMKWVEERVRLGKNNPDDPQIWEALRFVEKLKRGEGRPGI